MKNLIFGIILFLSIIILPWWVSALFAIFLLYYLKHFNEIIIFGLIMDIYYGQSTYYFTLFALILLLSSFFIKKRLKFYAR